MKSETLSFKNTYYSINIISIQLFFNKTSGKEDSQLFATKLTEKISDPCNAKEHYQPFIRKQNTKSVIQTMIITQQPKNVENPNIVDIKSPITEHPKRY